jgi:3-oxoacyl-(acyl-carrier-protein) synthase
VVAARGLVDERGVAGTSGVRARWAGLGAEPPGTARTFRALFGRPDATFRRIDPASKALVLAAEAAGLSTVLPPDARDDTGLVVESERGCLDADLRFQRGLQQGVVEGAVFPYTLPSASLGELALRYGLRGPAVCLSIGPGERGAALAEAARLVAEGEARFVVAGRVEAQAASRPGSERALHAMVVLLAAPGEAPGSAWDTAWDTAWEAAHGVLAGGARGGDAFEALAARLER